MDWNVENGKDISTFPLNASEVICTVKSIHPTRECGLFDNV